VQQLLRQRFGGGCAAGIVDDHGKAVGGQALRDCCADAA
jgi:hypothetical protein